MKRFLFLILLTCTAHAGELSLDINGVSHHQYGKYNEQNYGAGLSYSFAQKWQASAGFYKNSLYRESVYGLLGYEFASFGPVHVGVAGGLVTGYKMSVMPVAMPTATINAGPLKIKTFLLPPVTSGGWVIGAVLEIPLP